MRRTFQHSRARHTLIALPALNRERMTMEQGNLTDADILWNDVVDLLTQQNMAPSTLAMLRSCTIRSLTDNVLEITTDLGFARRKIEKEQPIIEKCLSTAAFTTMHLKVSYHRDTKAQPRTPQSQTITQKELSDMNQQSPKPKQHHSNAHKNARNTSFSNNRIHNILAEEIPESDSKLTFDRFISGEENMLALESAKQVANGGNKSYNPLFIYGKSGLGKTHLLRAIQNYIAANDQTRLCIYRTASQFVEDYRMSMNDPNGTPRNVLSQNYQDVDVLIIDDIQNMRTAGGSIRFFFETFNSLISHGKQIVLAADRSPSQLGMGDSKFDERDTSRMDSGVTVSIQVPDYELKLNLITTFYERMKADATEEHIQGMDGTIPSELLQLMADRAGTSIRLIKGFVQSCLMLAHQKELRGESLSRDDIVEVAQQKWPTGHHIVSVEQIQKTIEGYYDISHDDLIGSKRNRELMEPRHVAIWLTRELTNNTLAEIGKRFGNRTHATIKHSIAWVEELKTNDRLFYNRVMIIHDSIVDNSR